ncbi:MAG: adenosylcobinamide-GDP ribazoletransferase [Alphaproteobacteria bacterium]|nr:adenosylcobinamide-GDP ribazoletransferase [Alphaproteobacteria bacterium]
MSDEASGSDGGGDGKGRRLRELGAAWSLLTIVPVPDALRPETADFRASVWAYPLIGAGIGAAAAGAWLLGCWLLGAGWLAAALAVLAAVVLSGALHEDGLADSADALGARGDRERALAIMKDSRIGAFGTLALLLASALRIGAVAALAPWVGALVLVAAASASRAVPAVLLAVLPPARSDGLVASAGRPAMGDAQSAAGVACGIALAAGLFLSGSAGFGGALAWLLLGGALAAGAHALVAGQAERRIGGVTGDVCGAAQQLAEIGVLLAAVACLRD